MIDIHSSGASTAGQAYTLTCTATVAENLVVEPTLEWLDTDRNVVGGDDITVRSPITTGTNTTLTLAFNPLYTSHGGRYTCRARINIPVISLSNNSETSDVVVVQSKSFEDVNGCMCVRHTLCAVLVYKVKSTKKLMVACTHTQTQIFSSRYYGMVCMFTRAVLPVF